MCLCKNPSDVLVLLNISCQYSRQWHTSIRNLIPTLYAQPTNHQHQTPGSAVVYSHEVCMALRRMLGMPLAAQPVQAAVTTKPSRWSGPCLACALGTTRVFGPHHPPRTYNLQKTYTTKIATLGAAKIGWLCQTAVAPHESAHRIQVEFQPHGILHFFISTQRHKCSLYFFACVLDSFSTLESLQSLVIDT